MRNNWNLYSMHCLTFISFLFVLSSVSHYLFKLIYTFSLYKVLDRMQSCIAAIKSWMASNWLKLNDDKTEFITLGSRANLTKVSTEYITVGEHHIKKSQNVRNIGAIFDASFTMEQQVIRTAQTAWFHLFNISKIRSYLTKEQTQSTIHAYVTSRLDQNNSLLNGIPSYLTRRLQKIQMLLPGLSLVDLHMLPIFSKNFHWLPVSQRQKFKMLLIIYKTLHNYGPTYLEYLLPDKTMFTCAPKHITKAARCSPNQIKIW